jgi:holo-[acyl-carrier protein] synthase
MSRDCRESRQTRLKPPQVGIDLIEPDRIRDRLQRSPDLEGEIFTQAERDYCRAQPSPYEHLAARFCAKEAVAKALGMDGFEPLDIEIIEGGEVVDLALHGDAQAVAHAHRLEVSISLSHISGMAAAVALALPAELRVKP